MQEKTMDENARNKHILKCYDELSKTLPQRIDGAVAWYIKAYNTNMNSFIERGDVMPLDEAWGECVKQRLLADKVAK